MTDLSALFAEQQTNLIDVDGVPTYGLIKFTSVPSQVQVTFLAASDDPVQGVQLRSRGGTLIVNGSEASDIVLWRDSAPESITIDVRPAARGLPELRLWNVWRGGFDVSQAWLGNAAIQVEGDLSDDSFRLRCSDGHGEPNFDDLVVEVQTR